MYGTWVLGGSKSRHGKVKAWWDEAWSWHGLEEINILEEHEESTMTQGLKIFGTAWK